VFALKLILRLGSIPMAFCSYAGVTTFAWAAETVVLRRTVNPFPKGNTGGSNPSPRTKIWADGLEPVEHRKM
jgi:hypothetical protein